MRIHAHTYEKNAYFQCKYIIHVPGWPLFSLKKTKTNPTFITAKIWAEIALCHPMLTHLDGQNSHLNHIFFFIRIAPDRDEEFF